MLTWLIATACTTSHASAYYVITFNLHKLKSYLPVTLFTCCSTAFQTLDDKELVQEAGDRHSCVRALGRAQRRHRLSIKNRLGNIDGR